MDEKEAEAYARSVGAIHVGTSAKLNKGLEEIFLELTSSAFVCVRAVSCPDLTRPRRIGMLEREKRGGATSSAGGAGKKRRKLIIVDDDLDASGQSSGGCC